jgi:hypothetical protein
MMEQEPAAPKVARQVLAPDLITVEGNAPYAKVAVVLPVLFRV